MKGFPEIVSNYIEKIFDFGFFTNLSSKNLKKTPAHVQKVLT
jgi:hypothetical protein